jgi:hypothetical protein
MGNHRRQWIYFNNCGDVSRKRMHDDFKIFSKYAVRPDRLGKHFTKTQLDAEFVSDEDEN